MGYMKRLINGKSICILGVSLVVIIIALFLFVHFKNTGAQWANPHLNVAGIKFGMSRAQVESILTDKPIELAGETKEYSYRFETSGIEVSYDNKQSGGVRYLSITKPGYSAFGVQIGDDLKHSAAVLKQSGFRIKVNDDFASYFKLEGHGIVIILFSSSLQPGKVGTLAIELKKGRLSDNLDY